MSKKPMKLKIVAYDKAGDYFASRPLYAYQYSAAFEEFNKYVDLLTSGEFIHVGRIDLVDSNRILFSVLSLRHVINQNNFIINFKPM